MTASKERLELLKELEGIVGNSCYNANIQNWGLMGRFTVRVGVFAIPSLSTPTTAKSEKDRTGTAPYHRKSKCQEDMRSGPTIYTYFEH